MHHVRFHGGALDRAAHPVSHAQQQQARDSTQPGDEGSYTVTAEVTVSIPAIKVPMVGTIGSFTWTATSSARIDDYRSLGTEGQT